MARFNFVKIVVRDLAAMEQFYIAGLGFAVQDRIDAEGFSEVMLAQKAGAFTLVLYHHTDQRALDMATARVTERETFGKLLSDRQGVQFMLADCASELYMARLMLLHIAYKAERGMDLRQENSIAKVFLAHMVHKVVDTAIQLHGALGYSQDTPLAAWYTHIRSQRLVDGPDEVHRWTVGRNVIKAYKEHGTTASAAGGDLI